MTKTDKQWIVLIFISLLGGILIGVFTDRAWYGEQAKEGLHAPIAAPDSPPTAQTTPEQQITFEDLLDAIEMVESGGDPDAVGDNGEAVGSFQIHKIYVDEVNRILKIEGHSKRYTYDDRLDPFSSRVMTVIHCGWWHNKSQPYKYFGLEAILTLKQAEVFARIHNSGPDGWRNDPEWFVRNRDYTLEKAEKKIANTKEFWNKVQNSLDVSR
jgi:hypothetical protein